MKMAKTLLASVAAAMIVTAPVIAQESPSAGAAGGQVATWASMPVGSYVMIGGFIFIVTAAGLVLLDDEGNPVSTSPPATTTTTTTTTTSTP